MHISGRKNYPYKVSVVFKGEYYLNKRVKTIKGAVELRNQCIKENNLPHNIEQHIKE